MCGSVGLFRPTFRIVSFRSCSSSSTSTSTSSSLVVLAFHCGVERHRYSSSPSGLLLPLWGSTVGIQAKMSVSSWACSSGSTAGYFRAGWIKLLCSRLSSSSAFFFVTLIRLCSGNITYFLLGWGSASLSDINTACCRSLAVGICTCCCQYTLPPTIRASTIVLGLWWTTGRTIIIVCCDREDHHLLLFRKY